MINITIRFDGDWDESKKRVLELLGINNISKQPLFQVNIEYEQQASDDTTVIVAEEGKFYGLAFFACLAVLFNWKPNEWNQISLQHQDLAKLYYGEKLFFDFSKLHPSIEPFRRNGTVRVKLFYTEPNH